MITRSRADLILRSDNHDLFSEVRDKLNKRQPPIPITQIAYDLGVSVDELCRWFIAYRAPRKAKAYQSAAFPAIGEHKRSNGDDWSRQEHARRFIAWRKAKDGAHAALEAPHA